MNDETLSVEEMCRQLLIRAINIDAVQRDFGVPSEAIDSIPDMSTHDLEWLGATLTNMLDHIMAELGKRIAAS